MPVGNPARRRNHGGSRQIRCGIATIAPGRCSRSRYGSGNRTRSLIGGRLQGGQNAVAFAQFREGGAQALEVVARERRPGGGRHGGVADAARIDGLAGVVYGLARILRSSEGAALAAADGLDGPRALGLEDPLHAADRVALAVEEMADALEEIDVVGTVVAPPAAALQGPDLRKARLPEPQHML